MNFNSDVSRDADSFNGFKTKWINTKCSEAKNLYNTIGNTDDLFPVFEVIIAKLCSGPKFTEYQILELNEYYNEMQNVFANTKICLPVHFDVCQNLDHIWLFTYVRRPSGDTESLNMRKVIPEKYKKKIYRIVCM